MSVLGPLRPVPLVLTEFAVRGGKLKMKIEGRWPAKL